MRLRSFILQKPLTRPLQGPAKRISILMFAAVAIGCAVVPAPFAFGGADGEDSSPIFGVKIPAGYRQWELIAPSHEEGFDELRGILGNALSMKAYREKAYGTTRFRSQTARSLRSCRGSASRRVSSREPSSPARLRRFRSWSRTQRNMPRPGWGFGRFVVGKPVDEAQHETCFPCHQANVKGHDFVFTRMAP